MRLLRPGAWGSIVLLLALTLPLGLRAEDPPTISITDLTPNLSSGRSHAFAVNELGVVVGYAPRADGEYGSDGFLWDETNGYTVLDSSTSRVLDTATYPADINNVNQIVGKGLDGGKYRAFLWEEGNMTILPSLDSTAPNDQAKAINDVGQIIGESTSCAVIWEQDSTGAYAVTELPGLGGGVSSAQAINISGQVVGSARIAGGATWENRAVLWEKVSGVWQVTDLGAGDNSKAVDVNDLGLVIGQSNANRTGFVWESGTLTTLSYGEGQAGTTVEDVNDLNQIVGFVTLANSAATANAVMWQEVSGGWSMTDLDPDNLIGGYGVSRAWHVNNRGMVAGETYIYDYGMFAWTPQHGIRKLPALTTGGATTAPRLYRRIANDSGLIVGWSETSSSASPYHATAWAVPPDVLTPDEEIEEIVDDIVDLVNTDELASGEGTSLTKTLDSASAMVEDGNSTAAVNALGAFIKKVGAMVQSGRLSEEEGDDMIASAAAAIDGLEGG